jgi:hypothetical protein
MSTAVHVHGSARGQRAHARGVDVDDARSLAVPATGPPPAARHLFRAALVGELG